MAVFFTRRGAAPERVSSKNVVKITGSGHSTYSCVIVDGISYTSADEIEVEIGTVIYLKVGAIIGAARVIVDGAVVQSGAGSYAYTVHSDCTIALAMVAGSYGEITVTTS